MKFFYIALYSILFFLYANASFLYDESVLLYTIFTLVYFLLLYSAIYKPVSYSYLYLSIFLFLGMWLKLTLHLIFDYDYVEPIGSFYTLNTSMDNVLLIAIIGALGAISSNIIYRLVNLQSTMYIYENYIFSKPAFYKFYDTYRIYIYVTIMLSTLILVYLNITYNIQLSGLVPTTILLYPFNAIVSWVLGTGFSILLIVLFSLDIKFKNLLEMKYLILFALIVACTSIGLLSRGQYVFIVGSIIVFLFFNYKKLNNLNASKLILYIAFSAALYLFVIESVSALRGYYFSGASFSGASFSDASFSDASFSGASFSDASFSGASFSDASFSGASFSDAINKILHLAADRWIGLEGLMAVSSYEHRSFGLFFDALITKPEIGKIDIYQYISNAHYKDMDNTKFAFATIPGSMAFLYYTDSFLFVFFGMLILVLIMLAIEYYLYLWYKSALLTSIIGIYLANTIAQLGLMPINFLKSMFFTFSFLLIFKLIKIKKA